MTFDNRSNKEIVQYAEHKSQDFIKSQNSRPGVSNNDYHFTEIKWQNEIQEIPTIMRFIAAPANGQSNHVSINEPSTTSSNDAKQQLREPSASKPNVSATHATDTYKYSNVRDDCLIFRYIYYTFSSFNKR